MKKLAALMVMLSALSLATIAGCQPSGDGGGTGNGDDTAETGGDGNGGGGGDTGGNGSGD